MYCIMLNIGDMYQSYRNLSLNSHPGENIYIYIETLIYSSISQVECTEHVLDVVGTYVQGYLKRKGALDINLKRHIILGHA